MAELSRFTLRYEFIDVPLAEGEFVAGRAPECDLVLDDAAVSRRHACFRIEGSQVMVQDLQSRNGVLVNGLAIEEPTLLRHADRIRVGTRELVLHDSTRSRRSRDTGTTELIRCPTCGTMKQPSIACPQCGIGDSKSMIPDELPTIKMDPMGVPLPDQDPSQPRPTGALHTLARLADRALDMGRSMEAERLLDGTLQKVLSRARKGDSEDAVSESDAAKAAHYAMRLAELTGNIRWANYPLELYIALDLLMPQATIERFYGVVGPLRYKNPVLLRQYITLLRGREEAMGANERFILSRLDGLARMIASR